ncbi:MAG: kelch repeat-containing protein [Gemmatimonadota bacterium]|nr:kelch repeat-containing protein [Gemmatimonadota bacterium]
MSTHRVVCLLALAVGGSALSSCTPAIDAEGQRPPVSDVPTGTVAPAGSMAVPRSAHTATTLPDGRVLIAGGMTGGGGSAAGAELFDPRTGEFQIAGRMVTPRYSHSATVVPGLGVLIAGGYDGRGTYLQSAELYDPATGTFRALPAMTTARAGHAAVPLADGRVLLVGGVGTGWTFLASAELFDPATGAFSPTGGMAVARESHVAVRLLDGRVLVVGGHRGRQQAIELFTSTEIYDPAVGRFAPTGAMQVRRHKHDAVLLQDGRVLVTGGSDERDSRGVYSSTEIFDPVAGVFRAQASLQVPRYKHAASSVLLPDGRVLIGGGAGAAELYDPAMSRFLPVFGSDDLAGQFSATALLPGGRVLITGGYGVNPGATRNAWMYTPEGG